MAQPVVYVPLLPWTESCSLACRAGHSPQGRHAQGAERQPHPGRSQPAMHSAHLSPKLPPNNTALSSTCWAACFAGYGQSLGLSIPIDHTM